MSHSKNKVEWCLKKAERELKEEGKHRGLAKATPDIAKAREHIAKAENNLKVMELLYKNKLLENKVPPPVIGNISYEQTKSDSVINTVIDSSQLVDGNLIVKFHHDSDKGAGMFIYHI